MSIEKNCWTRALIAINETNASNTNCVRIENVAAITLLALLILAGCAFAKVGAFSHFNYSHIVGFTSLGIVATFVLVKATSTCVHYWVPQITDRAHIGIDNTKDP